MQTLCLRGEHFKAQIFKDIFLPVNLCNGERSRGDSRQTDRAFNAREQENGLVYCIWICYRVRAFPWQLHCIFSCT